ncbi:MAG: pyridoxal phosphate-dependent aminotransferase [Synergistaceae bacterium]|jgi:aspartate aminotransferase|nr:pyridoxal phosphate-dependent aminotransferase [Synergistaceae bacterium]
MKLSKRVEKIQPSATLSVLGIAKKLKGEGYPVLSFSAGEPDFISPKSALDAARDAIDRGETHYTINSGIPELKNAVAGYYSRRFGLNYETSEIIISSGAKPVVYEALQTLVDPGDEVLVFAPAWVSYVEQIKMSDGRPIAVDTSETGFVPTVEGVESKLSPRTVGMILNSPNNPTGAVYDEATLKALARLAEENDIWVIFDEIYERLVYGDTKFVNILNAAPGIRDRVILINGVSKTFCMTGWRIGYALGPKRLITKMGDIQSHFTSNASSIAQWAAVGAIEGAEDDAERCRSRFAKRRDILVSLLNGIDGLRIESPAGAFYVFADVRNTPIPDDIEFCERLLSEKFVALVPGAAFLAPGFVRISYACGEDDIREGVGRIEDFLKSKRAR